MSGTEKINISLEDLWNGNQRKQRIQEFNIVQAVHESLMISNVYQNNFDWEKYVQTYSDIIEENSDLPWNWENISCNQNITID